MRGGNHLPRGEQRDVVHGFARGRRDDVLQALGADGVLLVGQLQQFRLVHGGAGARGELLGHVAAFETGDDVKAGGADDAGHLLDGDVRVAAQVGHVAGVVLVGEDEADGVAVARESFVQPGGAAEELLARRHVLAVDGGGLFEDAEHALQVLAVIGDSKFGGVHVSQHTLRPTNSGTGNAIPRIPKINPAACGSAPR